MEREKKIKTTTENFSERRGEKEKHGRTDRQIDRCDVDRQTGRQVGRHTDKQTDKHTRTETQTHRWRYRKTDTQMEI